VRRVLRHALVAVDLVDHHASARHLQQFPSGVRPSKDHPKKKRRRKEEEKVPRASGGCSRRTRTGGRPDSPQRPSESLPPLL
jgi:hypothetical protein